MRPVDKSIFIMFEKRLKLLYKLKDSEFYVRMHAYEYLVGTKNRMIAIILLEPNKNIVEILQLERANDSDIKEIIAIIKSLDPSVKVNVKSFKS